MAKQPKGELVVGFKYELLETKVADRLRLAADRIRQKVKQTTDDIIAIGKDILGVKEALPHGQFGHWLDTEFGWTERTARNFMAVAERFGPKSEMISDLKIAPTAAYLLAAPSASDEARQAAIERFEAGETITSHVAKEILAKLCTKTKRKGRPISTDELGLRLLRVLDRYRERWNQQKLSELARHLRGFADTLVKRRSGQGKRVLNP